MGKTFNILQFPGQKAKAFTLSYDDGVLQDKRLIAIFDRYGVKCTFNLGYGVLGSKGKSGPADRQIDISKVETSEVKELYKDHEVGGHGLYHSDLAHIAVPNMVYEIAEDKAKLEALVGHPLSMFAYPFGLYNEDVKKVLKQVGYKGARTVRSTHGFDLPEDPFELHPTCHHNDPKLMELAEDFVTAAPLFKPLLFYVWGHGYEFDGDDNWERIEKLVSYVSRYKDDIWFATNGQILSYMKAYDMLEYSVDGSMVYNPSCIDVDILNAAGYREHLKAGTVTYLQETPL